MSDPKIAAASHLGTDWKDQWQRLLRHGRDVAIPLSDTSEHDRVVDGVISFCKECDALPDWLIRSGFRQADVHAVVSASPALRWSRDIANGMSHFKLSPTKATTTHKEWTTTTVSTVYISGGGAPDLYNRWAFTDLETGEMLNPRDLVDARLDACEEFLPCDRHVPIPEITSSGWHCSRTRLSSW